MTELQTIKDSILLSQAIPDEYLELKEGCTFAITAVILVDRVKGDKSFKQARLHGLSLPDGMEFVKYRTSAGAIVRKCEDLLHRACFADGNCKKAVRVKVIGTDGTNGRWLDLVDA